METAPTAKKVRGRPFTGKSDPRVKAGPGRPVLSPEEKAARMIQRRAVADVKEELRRHLDLAIDVVEAILLDPKASEASRLAAANVVLDRVVGKPAQTVAADVRLNASIRQVSAAELAAAAAAFANGD